MAYLPQAGDDPSGLLQSAPPVPTGGALRALRARRAPGRPGLAGT